MSVWWNEEHGLLLVTPEEFAALPEGEVLTCIDGSTAIKGRDEIDDDTRAGHLAYGVVGNHPLRLKHLEKMAALPAKPPFVAPPHKAWSCTIGARGDLSLPRGADAPMRQAVAEAFFQLTGRHAEFNFSGWGAQLDEVECLVAFGDAA